jgi:hypothetical protein
MKYGTDLLQLLLNSVTPGLLGKQGFMTLDVYAYNGKKGSSCDTTLATFSDQQRPLGNLFLALPHDQEANRVVELISKMEDLEDDEELGISTSIGFGSNPSADPQNYFLPVLDMVVSAESFKSSMATLVAMKNGGRFDPIHEFLQKYQFTVLDTGKSLHLVARNLLPDRDRTMDKFLAQALMFPSLGVDQAWVGHCIFRQWMGLRISANKRATAPTINTELTALLRSLNQELGSPDQGQIGQAKPESSGVEGNGF